MTIKILDLFAGAGGLSLGFELVRDSLRNQVFKLHRAVEIDKWACETLRKRYGSERVIQGDITKYRIADKIVKECRNKVSVIVGGIPCQSFSLIGPRSGFGKKVERFKRDARDNLYEHFRDIVAKIKPKVIVIENVKGILSKKDNNGRKIIDKLLSDFECMGYNFENKRRKKYFLLNTADFGIPQNRERVILIGVKKRWKNLKIPLIEPTHYNPTYKNAKELIGKHLKPNVTIYDAIGDLPKVNPKITYNRLSKYHKKLIKKKNATINNGKDLANFDKTRFQKHLNNTNLSRKEFFSFIRPKEYPYLHHHVARSQQLSDHILFKYMKQGETASEFIKRRPKLAKRLIKYDMSSFKDKYRKQCSNRTCTTIFAHLEKDGNRFIHPTQSRTLTPREAARIQSFPDDFIFGGPMSKKFKQIGNAVPPLLAKNIGELIKSILKW